MQLRIQNLSKRFGAHLVLKDISLSIPKGQFVSLLGPSGSGKTTLLRCISGLERHEMGSVEIAGKVQSDQNFFIPPEKRNLGMVFQSYAVWPHMTVFENVAFPLRIRKDSEVKKKTEQALDLVRLTSESAKFPFEISGGQQQRVALARALVVSPQMLLLDEPLSNLDALLREELGREIRTLQTQLNLTTIMVTHDQREALSFSDYMVLMNQGAIDCEGSPERLYRETPTPFATDFLAGGVRVSVDGSLQTMIPRKLQIAANNEGIEVQVIKTFFCGHEYEIWGSASNWSQPVKFFSPNPIPLGSKVRIKTTAN